MNQNQFNQICKLRQLTGEELILKAKMERLEGQLKSLENKEARILLSLQGQKVPLEGIQSVLKELGFVCEVSYLQALIDSIDPEKSESVDSTNPT